MEDAERKILEEIRIDLENAKDAADPKPEDLFTFDFVPTPIVEEKGIREPKGARKPLWWTVLWLRSGIDGGPS